MATEDSISEDAFPVLFTAADRASVRGQRRYLRATRLRLLLAISAAATATVALRVGHGRIDLMAVATAAAFAATAFVELYLLSERPERAWYDGRALAESTKTLTWRYAVGAAPFPIGTAKTEEEIRRHFSRQLEGLLRDAPDTGIETPADGASGDERIAALRASSLSERKRAYVIGRVADQQHWYSAKAEFNRVRAHRWRLVLIAAELLGLVAAILRALGVYSIDLAGILAAVVGSGAGWLAVKQHDSLARAYALAANELAIARSRLEQVTDEAAWAAEVADAEEAISREHTMWRASRSAGLRDRSS